MPHESSLIEMIAIGLVFAFIGGAVAVRLRLPPVVGYLLAGIAIGPFTPGFVGDAQIASQLAEIGVILLMFGVGMHFSVRDLWAVRALALPGAIAQIAVATALGAALAWWWDWPAGGGIVFGLALSVASTVVLLRVLQSAGIVDTEDGRIAVGWLVVEDLVMVLTLVVLPALAAEPGSANAPAAAGGATPLWQTMAVTLGRVALFVLLMLVAGTRAFPWLLQRVERSGSRELFTLAIVALSLGVAFVSSLLFGVSFALGAFFAGVVLNGSHLSARIADDLQPLQDAFGVLFFVAVGMLFDPMILIRQPWQVLAVVAVVTVGKSLASFLIVLLLRRPLSTALIVSASLAQIGEFSFILGALGMRLGLLPTEGYNLILAGALLSITVNPLLFSFMRRWPRALPVT